MPTPVVLCMLWNVKRKLIVRLMLKPVLNLGTMESTAIPINIKDSTMDTLMVKDPFIVKDSPTCVPTPHILPLPTPDILPLPSPDLLWFKDQILAIPWPMFSRLKFSCNERWRSLLKIMKFLHICTFHLANICIIKIRIFQLKHQFFLDNKIAMISYKTMCLIVQLLNMYFTYIYSHTLSIYMKYFYHQVTAPVWSQFKNWTTYIS